jgi:hypothetical protein
MLIPGDIARVLRSCLPWIRSESFADFHECCDIVGAA